MQRRLPADGDPAALRRGLTVEREDAVRARRWLPAVLVLPAGGHRGRGIRLVDALLEELGAGSSAVPPDLPR